MCIDEFLYYYIYKIYGNFNNYFPHRGKRWYMFLNYVRFDIIFHQISSYKKDYSSGKRGNSG